MEQASPDLLAIPAPAKLAFRVHLAFLSPRLTFLLGVERERGESPSLDGLRIEMGESPSASERLVRRDLRATFAQLEREARQLHLFGPRMRSAFQKVGGLWPVL